MILLICAFFIGYIIGYIVRRCNEVKSIYSVNESSKEPPKNPYGFDTYEVKSQMTSEGVRYVIYKNDKILTYKNSSGGESFFTYPTYEKAEEEVEKMDV